MNIIYPCFEREDAYGAAVLECLQPHITTSGTPERARAEMHAVLIDMLAQSLANRTPFPLPDRSLFADGSRVSIAFSMVETMKVFLINAMIETDTTVPRLAQRLGISEIAAERLVDPTAKPFADKLGLPFLAPNLEPYVRAISATGKRVKLTLV